MNVIFLSVQLCDFPSDSFTTTDSNLIKAAGLWKVSIGSVLIHDDDTDHDADEDEMDQEDLEIRNKWQLFKQQFPENFTQIVRICKEHLDTLIYGDDDEEEEIPIIPPAQQQQQQQQQQRQQQQLSRGIQSNNNTRHTNNTMYNNNNRNPVVQLNRPGPGSINKTPNPIQPNNNNNPSRSSFSYPTTSFTSNTTIFTKTTAPSLSIIPTFISQLDYSLGGGLPTNQITELSSSTLLGKTQIAIQSALSATLPFQIIPTIRNIPLKYLTFHHQQMYPQLIDEIYNDYAKTIGCDDNMSISHTNNKNNGHDIIDTTEDVPHFLSPTLCLKVVGFVPQSYPDLSNPTRSIPSKLTHQVLPFPSASTMLKSLNTSQTNPTTSSTIITPTSSDRFYPFIDTYSAFIHTSSLDPDRFTNAANIISRQSMLNHCLIDAYGVFSNVLEEYIIIPPKKLVTPPSLTDKESIKTNTTSNSIDPFITSHYNYLNFITQRYNELLATKSAGLLPTYAPLDLYNPTHLPFIKQLFKSTVSQFEWDDVAYCKLDLYHLTNQQCCCHHRFPYTPQQLLYLINVTKKINSENWQTYLTSSDTPKCACNGHLTTIPYPQFSPRSLLRRCVLLHAPTLHSLLHTTSSLAASINSQTSVQIPQFCSPDDYEEIIAQDKTSANARIVAIQRGYYQTKDLFPSPLQFTTPTTHPDSTLMISRLGLLCVDNIATSFRGIDTAAHFMSSLGCFVDSIHALFRAKAPAQNIAVLCINQVTTAVSHQSDASLSSESAYLIDPSQFADKMVQIPALGENWGSIVHNRFFLYPKKVVITNEKDHYSSICDPLGRVYPIKRISPCKETNGYRTNKMIGAFVISKISYIPPQLHFLSLEQYFTHNTYSIVYSIHPESGFITSLSNFNPTVPIKTTNKYVLLMDGKLELQVAKKSANSSSNQSSFRHPQPNVVNEIIVDSTSDDDADLKVVSVKLTPSIKRFLKQ